MNLDRSSLATRSQTRPAFTLVELLVVVLIAAILMVVTIPVVRNGIRERARREAARQVNTLLASARAEATGTGLAHGVWIERSRNNPNAAFQLYLAEVPEHYAGDTTNSKVAITLSSDLNGPVPPTRYLRAWFVSNFETGIDQLVQAGDRIRFNGRGATYRIAGKGTLFGTQYVDFLTGVFSSPTVVADTRQVDTLPIPPYLNIVPDATFFPSSTPVPLPSAQRLSFVIERSPVRSTTPAFEMPATTVIDLALSGIGSSQSQFLDRGGPVVIMFTPQGIVEDVYLGNAPGQVVSPIYLHIGRADQTVAFADPAGPFNKTDGDNFWVMVNNANGSVVTASNVLTDPGTGFALADPTTPFVLPTDNLAGMRSLARNQLVVGGQ